MNKYEESAKRIMERGDIILEKKKKRIIRISRTAGAITGLCAVFAIGFGIWNNSVLKDSAKPPVIDESSIIVPVTEGSTEGTTAYIESDVQTSSENKKNEMNVTTEKITNEKTTESAVSVTPNLNQTAPTNTFTTAKSNVNPAQTTVAVAGSTASADTVTHENTTATQRLTTVKPDSEPRPSSTTVKTTAPTITPTTTKKPALTEDTPQQTTTAAMEGPVDGGTPPTTAAATRPTPTGSNPGGSNPTGPTDPTNPPAGSAAPPPSKFSFGSNPIIYTRSDEDVEDEFIGEYLGSLYDGADIYSMIGVPKDEAVVLDFYGKYYIYYNRPPRKLTHTVCQIFCHMAALSSS